MKVLLVTGGRSFKNWVVFCEAMRRVPFEPGLIVQGGCTGADSLARRFGDTYSIHYATFPALWTALGPSAGNIRNGVMISGLIRIDCCLALPGGSGTDDMVSKCLAAGIPVYSHGFGLDYR